MENNWNGLVEGIVAQAVEDYKEAVQIIGRGEPKTKKQAEKYRRALRMQREVESFFRSRWFAKLTGVNGKVVLASIRQRMGLA
jgi:predicted NAD-dependent protein-ADP-ribosyltransferase YbiA (DUF1768 family)